MELKVKVKVGCVEDETMPPEPVSPTGQYFNSSVLSVSIISVLEFDNPIDDSSSVALINNVFLPINPRFSSIMVEDGGGGKHWKRVEVKVEDHIKVPHFPEGLSPESYDHYFHDYLSKLAMDPLAQTRPLWEIHIFKYPTSNASGSLVFKLHHALGDGYSLMGALLSCLQRADNPSLPLSFPNTQKAPKQDKTFIPQVLSGVLNTVFDFCCSVLKSSFVEDNQTSIRSCQEGVEFLPINIMTVTFSLDQIKKIKSNLQVSKFMRKPQVMQNYIKLNQKTINDVITGIIFLGIRLYMETTCEEAKNARSTALVLLNTRSVGGYKSVNEMVQNKEGQVRWGNQLAFLHVSLPKLSQCSNPLKFVQETRNVINRKRNSSAIYLTGMLLETIRKYKGPEAASRYIRNTLKNSSLTVSNIIGPVEKMTLANQPVKGLYFMVVSVPQSLTVTIMSYMDQLRVAVGTEKGLIDQTKFKKCIEKAFVVMYDAAAMPK